MADPGVAGQVLQVIFVESLADQSHGGAVAETYTIGGTYPRALLPSVLEGEEAEEDDASYIFAFVVNPYYPARLSDPVRRRAGRRPLVSVQSVMTDSITLPRLPPRALAWLT